MWAGPTTTAVAGPHLGSGTFGRVYTLPRGLPAPSERGLPDLPGWSGTCRVIRPLHTGDVVVKRFADGGQYTTLREMSLLSRLDHPFIVRCVGWTVAPIARVEVYLQRAHCDLEQLVSQRALRLDERRVM